MNILFLCTGNSCRSQMAEGWARQFAPPDWHIHSAGIDPHGLNPHAVATMGEVGIDISMQQSTQVSEAMLQDMDLVVTVCGHADEHCPVLPAYTRKEHWPLEDPARASGTEQEVMAVFRASRDEIRERVQTLITSLLAEQQGVVA